MITKQELLSNLKSAETGSPELSAEVFKYFNPDTKWKRSELSDEEVYIIDKYGSIDFPPELTTSIDAAVKYVSKKGLYRLHICERGYGYEAYLFLIDPDDEGYFSFTHKSLPIAIMIALIEATEEGKT